MKKLFDSIPSASQVREWLDDNTERVIQDFAQKVSKAMQSLSNDSFTLQSTSEFSQMYHGIHWQKVRAALEEKWWRAQLISDQRDWDYFKITMLSWSTWQPMTD